MKFAKELENELVPEWRVKYLNYKQGKKKVKAVARALRSVNQTPRIGGRWRNAPDSTPSAGLPYTHYDFSSNRLKDGPNHGADSTGQDAGASPLATRPAQPRRESLTVLMRTPPLPVSARQPLKETSRSRASSTRTTYGSIVGSPPQLSKAHKDGLQPLKLPGPALGSESLHGPDNQSIKNTESGSQPAPKDAPPSSDAYHVGSTHPPRKRKLGLPRHLRFHRSISTPYTTGTPHARRMISSTHTGTPSSVDVPLEAYQELDKKQDDFFQFLDSELGKIENFYSTKEKEASERLDLLRAQLHEMRDRRMDEITPPSQNGRPAEDEDGEHDHTKNGHLEGPGFLKPLGDLVSRGSAIGKTTAAMAKLGSPSKRAEDQDRSRDYVKRHDPDNQVTYRSAKRKLKVALQEFYRGLELLKSYSLVNRTAFRKINKKYDKAVNARPTGRYVADKVNQAYFVRSDLVESYIVAVEDLYSRYFERGNRKVAVGKLRSKLPKAGEYSQTSFRNGIWLASGIALGTQGWVYGYEHLFFGTPEVRLQTSFLLQIYAGYFLSLLLFMLFTLDCRIWAVSKINYVFVFEFDSRHVLEWIQLAEMPAFFLFLNGLFLFLNFRQNSEDAMFLYWPVLLIGITVVTIAIPFRVLHHRSRQWFGYSMWRLVMAGLYPVEFRDFFLGDMFCSLTYAMGNIEVFFCLYADGWSSPSHCNSRHSRLLGFFTTLPAIWRAFQCLRRYHDSGNWFPHLANFGKYTFSILYYMSLSLWRVDQTAPLRVLFIVFAFLNATYCSVWDIAMDWSLGDPFASHPFLRDMLGYRQVWIYYVAMVVDPIIRFAWIFYAIFALETQHSTLVSFLIALAEILRRAMWALFRVENEHCTNVVRFRASRDCPLPYSIETSPELTAQDRQSETQEAGGVDIEQQAPSTGSASLRLRRTRTPADVTPIRKGLRRMGTIINQAHAQDFERKSRPGIVGDDAETDRPSHQDSSDDDDDEEASARDDEATADMVEAHDIVERAQK